MTTERNIHLDVVTATFDDDERPPTPSAGSANKRGIVSMQPVKYFREDAALTADTMTVEVEINASSSTTAREGLDLVVVLDIIGSTKDENSIWMMKKAMHFVIMKLTPMDRLSICAFSKIYRLRSMTPAAQKELRDLIDDLEAQGGSNIGCGLANAVTVLKQRVYTKGRAAAIFLMSDGRQSDGNARKVDVRHVPVYTFGFGKDSAEQLLLADIAKNSLGGTFSSVPDGTNLSIPVSQLLGGLLTVVAQDVQITLTPNTADGDVGAIAVSPGTDYTHEKHSGTGVITIKFGTLFAGEGRRVVITIDLEESNATDEYDATLAEAQPSYTVQGKLRKEMPSDIQILRTQNPSNTVGKARELADKRPLEEARYKLTDAQEDIAVNDGGKLVNGLRAELQQLLELMDTQELYEAQGRPYALTAEPSHARQRYTAKGGDDTIDDRVFSTPRMDNYLKQAIDFEKDPSKPVTTAGDDNKKAQEANQLGAIAAELSGARQREATKGGNKDINDRLFSTPRMAEYIKQANDFEKVPSNSKAAGDEDKKEREANPLGAIAAEISHARLRETTKGGNKDVNDRLFSTPRMDEYIRQAKDFKKSPSEVVVDDDKEEREANPLGAIPPELALYLQNAIQALRAIQKIITPST